MAQKMGFPAGMPVAQTGEGVVFIFDFSTNGNEEQSRNREAIG
jgi:hypothetical protein